MKAVKIVPSISLIAFALSGCISDQIAKRSADSKVLAAETATRLESAQACCGSAFQGMNFQLLQLGVRREILLDSSTAAFPFSFGKSRFQAFEIPTTSVEVDVQITAIEVQSGKSAKPIFRPRVVLLDSRYQLVEHQPQLGFDKFFFGATTEGHSARFRIDPSRVRYIVVAADPTYIGREFVGGGKSYLAPAGSAYVGVSVPNQGFPYGYEGKGFITIGPTKN